jgi:hypothetical protein
VASAVWEGQPLGFGVQFSDEWEEQKFDDGPSVSWGTLTLTRTGTESDFFVRTLAEAFDAEEAPERMADSVEFSAAAIVGHPLRLQDGPVELKLFFNADEEERYAELLCRIDTSKASIELGESDPDYRDAILDAFSA